MRIIDGEECLSYKEVGNIVGRSRHTIKLWYKAGELTGWKGLPCILPPRLEIKEKNRITHFIRKEDVGMFLYFRDNIKPGSLKPAMDTTRSEIGLDEKYKELAKYRHYFED